MKMIRLILPVLWGCCINLLHAQNEAINWYFGHAALNFSTFPPADMGNNASGAMEGCASMSDAAGNLLMYTNGVEVFNKNHQLMANGGNLYGHYSSTQAALIVKKPGAAHEYYIFTTNQTTVDPFAYSIVDMSLAAGLGSVTVKNVTVAVPVTEKLAATYHCNGQDIWIVVHKQNSNEFYSYLFTSAGLSSTPVVSAAGSDYSSGSAAAGQLKISPAGNKLAAAVQIPGTLELFDFDPATGVVSNGINVANFWGNAYGCEFSPDGSKLYGTALLSNPPTVLGVLQWDLCAGSSQAIVSSQMVVDTSYIYAPAGMQLGPYNRIYISRDGLNKLGTVEAPNLAGLSCNTTSGAVVFTHGMCRQGLPNLIGNWFRQKPSASASVSACSSVAFSYTAACNSSGAAPDSIIWIFDDPASGSADTSFLANPVHVYPAGNKTYHARLLAHFRCYTDTIHIPVQIDAYPSLNVAPLTTICLNEAVTITAGGAATYSWSTGAKTQSVVLSPAATTIYTVSGTSQDGCTASVPFTVAVDPCTGVKEHPEPELKLFPNPVKSHLTVSSNCEGMITMTDIYGRVMGTFVILQGENEIQVASVEVGLYFFHFRTAQGRGDVIRVIKQ